jgi:GTP-binding protein EngB required for normal cell division
MKKARRPRLRSLLSDLAFASRLSFKRAPKPSRLPTIAGMTRSRLPLRLILFGLLALAAVVLLWFAVSLLNGLLEFYERVQAMPLLLRVPLIVLAAAIFAALLWFGWKLLRPARARPTRAASRRIPDRTGVEARVAELREQSADVANLEQELLELDRRRLGGECHVALFGEISTGKSSLLRQLASENASAIEADVIGGTTRQVSHYRGRLPDGRELVIADMPGSGEVSGQLRELLARDEALRAHAVVYLAASDLGRAQDAELRWLAGFGKPLILALNKVDQFQPAERDALLDTLRQRYRDVCRAIVGLSAGGREVFERRIADGRLERVERERRPEIDGLLDALQELTRGGSAELEAGREAAVLSSIELRSQQVARKMALRDSEACVTRYTRRAVIGAMAAVAPGTDIIIQGALGTAMVRELARIHAVPVRDIDIEQLLARIGLTIRSTTAIVLAIAGNAMKAFPGLGTLGGGVVHAFAYGLAFDSLGRALNLSLAEHARLDQLETERHLRDLLSEPGRERIERVARLVIGSLRKQPEAD